MSNLWFNIRFGLYHWQWGPNGMTFKKNIAHAIWKETSPNTWKRFEVYTIFGKTL